MIYLLLLFLSITLICNLYFSDFSFGAPSVIFPISLLFSTAWSVAYAKIWNVSIGDTTLFVMIGGTFAFSISCFAFASLNKKLNPGNTLTISELEISKGKTLFIIIVEIIVLLIYIRSIHNSTGINQLSSAINSLYRQESELSLPLYTRILIIFIRAVGYWFSFIFVLNLYSKRKIEWLSVVAIGISVVCSTLTGSRGNAVCILGSIFAFFLLLHGGNHKKIKIRYLIFTVLLITIGLWIFPRVSNLLGRTTKIKPIDYLAAYLGAEPYTLDKFLRWNDIPIKAHTWGGLTFYSLVSSISKYLGIDAQRPAVYQYYYSNGYFMGNVNTLFFEPLCDFGYGGYLIIIAVYGAIAQTIFDYAKKSQINNNVPISILLYGYIFAVLALSFFAWWFGNFFISTTFLYMILSWVLLNIFFFRMKFTIKFRN